MHTNENNENELLAAADAARDAMARFAALSKGGAAGALDVYEKTRLITDAAAIGADFYTIVKATGAESADMKDLTEKRYDIVGGSKVYLSMKESQSAVRAAERGAELANQKLCLAVSQAPSALFRK